MTLLRVDPADVQGEKGRAALARYRVIDVAIEDPARFEETYVALHEEFGVKGELERREVVEGWLRAKVAGSAGGYHLLAAYDEDGRLAGARDFHLRIDRRAHAVVAYLAHVLVRPDHRRGGLASLLRGTPLTLARAARDEAGPGFDVVLAGEMEPIDPADPDTTVRLLAYARAGFWVIDPTWLPYCQPDFRDLAKLGVPPRHLPFLAVVRVVGREHEDTIERRLAVAFVENLYSVFGTHCREQDLAPPREHALSTLAAHAGDRVPLLRLPQSPDDAAAIGRLLREKVLPHHSEHTLRALG